MKNEILKYIKLFLGFFVCSLGIVLIIRSNLGFSPWDVLHQGISKVGNITIGQASILVGILVITLDVFLGEQIGSGTVFNIIFIGVFMDLILFSKLIPLSHTPLLGVPMMFMGLFILGVGCYLYISTGLGCGPRDALMVALTKKTNFSIMFIRSTIEVTVLVIGYFLGGYAGVGTVITAVFTGSFIQYVFKMFDFDVKSVTHRNIKDEAVLLKAYILKK
ncbi:YczE/YyaS/YitT family protein [Psychrilyobacter atlanticus]|uniref:YczE/YyaS/YitT family protein n=1 Tax=Psychrilyobacter atlanticus TaxID=271091 RepID=UPI000426BC97|nr:membrane protein [Psychrilyobacter atlanticus]